MISRSLRWRLLLGAAAAILLALGVAWVFMTLLFERHLEGRLQEEMTRDALQLVAGLPLLEHPPDDPRFQKPAGGYYWQVSGATGARRSRSLWDSALAVPPDVPAKDWRLRLAAGPFEPAVFVLERRVTLDAAAAPTVVQLAQDRSTLAGARREFGLELAGFLGILWVALSLAAWVQVALGLRPMRAVRGDLSRLKASASERLPDPALDDLRPLVDEINALADARERDLEQARRRAADLAHGLKTPLAALAAQGRRAREQGAVAAADGMERALAAIGAAIEAELARARIAAAGRAAGASAGVLEVVERLLTVLEHTERGGELAFAVDLPASLTLPVRADDLAELLGPVLENAVRYARRQVRVRGDSGAAETSVIVEDDGPGIPADRIETALSRGGRLDESESGSGLGLSIARELAAAMGGRIALGKSLLGGLEVRFTWPAAASAPQ